MNPHIFRQYDIRGIAETDLDNETVFNLGKSIGSEVYDRVGKDATIAVGFDMRISSARLFERLSAGIISTGINVKSLGMVPTPLVYFSKYFDAFDGCVQITGSHNPGEYNGFKMMIGADTLHGDDIQDLKNRILEKRFEVGSGTLEDRPGIIEDYLAWVKDNLEIDADAKRPKVVVDCGNGIAGVCAMDLVEGVLGCEAIGMYLEPDGNFPNHHPDPTVPENLVDLSAAVKKHNADFGVAYDGDGDRIGIVDENGEMVFGDMLMVILSRALLAEIPGAKIIGEVKCSQHLFDDIENHGGEAIMAMVGHSLIKAKIKETNAQLAGEMSGHVFYNDRFFGFDDALYTTARLVEIFTKSDKTISQMLEGIPESFATPELRLECADSKKFDIPKRMAEVLLPEYEVNTMDGVRVKFAEGWGLCRASNTQPALVLRVEATSAAHRDEYLSFLKRTISEVS